AFYHRPQSIADLVAQTTGRILDLLGIENSLVKRWPEIEQD
ncbi:MAG: aromatic acid decarboxylase, partial [Moorella sp. (in: Bacteria)]|nr:aromatic acid decarboxylase [Moorella sp. (in: firmicutes)]